MRDTTRHDLKNCHFGITITMSFATLEEAWGDVGANKERSVAEPEPCDSAFGRDGAPIMDDIVRLYTAEKPTTPEEKPIVGVRAPASQRTEARKAAAKRTRIRKGDDYSDESGGDSDRENEKAGQRKAYDDNHVIELAAYVLSGIMLIFVFESFITIGSSLAGRSRGYY